jgi:hypothetical protein
MTSGYLSFEIDDNCSAGGGESMRRCNSLELVAQGLQFIVDNTSFAFRQSVSLNRDRLVRHRMFVRIGECGGSNAGRVAQIVYFFQQFAIAFGPVLVCLSIERAIKRLPAASINNERLVFRCCRTRLV